jgi:hypothetical protein
MPAFEVSSLFFRMLLFVTVQAISAGQVPQAPGSVCQVLQDAVKGGVVLRNLAGFIESGGHGSFLTGSKGDSVDIAGVRVPCHLFIEFGKDEKRNKVIQEKLDRIIRATAGKSTVQVKSIYIEVLAIVESESQRAIASTYRDATTRHGYGDQGVAAGRLELLDIGRVTIEFQRQE